MRQKQWVVDIVVKSNLNVVSFDVECFFVIILQSYLWFNIFWLRILFQFKLTDKTAKPGGEHITQDYAKTKCLTDATRRQMINILAAELTGING